MPWRLANASNSADVYWADSSGRRNTPISRGVTLGRTAAWMSTKTGRAPMRSPGRPPPRREVERAFWVKIAEGLSSEDAAVAVGVSGPVGSRWFRQRGGMSASLGSGPSSGRYLAFAVREEIALLRAQGGQLEYRASVAQWKAERAARRPKSAKLVKSERLRDYVQDRLAGQVRRPDGTPVPGPATAAWKGRNKPRRQDRRWATAWSPEQVAHPLAGGLLRG